MKSATVRYKSHGPQSSRKPTIWTSIDSHRPCDTSNVILSGKGDGLHDDEGVSRKWFIVFSMRACLPCVVRGFACTGQVSERPPTTPQANSPRSLSVTLLPTVAPLVLFCIILAHSQLFARLSCYENRPCTVCDRHLALALGRVFMRRRAPSVDDLVRHQLSIISQGGRAQAAAGSSGLGMFVW